MSNNKCSKCSSSGNCTCSSNCKAGNVVLPEGPKGDTPVITIENGIVVVDGVSTGQDITGPSGTSIINITDNGDGTWTINYSDGSNQIVNPPAATISVANIGTAIEVYNSGSGTTKQFRTLKPKGFNYGVQGASEITLNKQEHVYHKINELASSPAFHYYNPVTESIINPSFNGKDPSNPIIMDDHFIYMRPFGRDLHFISYNIDIVYTPPSELDSTDGGVVSITFVLAQVGNESSGSGVYYQTSQANTDPLLSGDGITSQGVFNLPTLNGSKNEEIIQYPIIANDIQTNFYDFDDSVTAPSYDLNISKFAKFVNSEKNICKVLFGAPHREEDFLLTGYTAPGETADNFLSFGFIPVKIGVAQRFKCRGSMFVTNEYKYL